MIAAIVMLSGLLLAYANGANDNFKGVATLFGSGTTGYGRALAWATLTTFLGSLAAVLLADKLLTNFSGKGLVDGSLVASADYTAAVALGAGLTVVLATRIGMPISTTHSLVGSLVGAGIASGSQINLLQLGGTFFLPLLVSPLVAVAATAIAYPLLRGAGRILRIPAETQRRVGNEEIEAAPPAALDRLHFLTAGAVSFARGLNDTPKIAALLLVAPSLGGFAGTGLVGLAIAAGGLLNARRVAETMSRKITTMNHGQGCTANLMTSLIVIGASPLGMPVSTTHVACGSLFGIGAATGQAHWAMIGKILLAWITTLPLAAALGAMSGWIIQSV
jgi:PiT family inorganic phosphate transporter